MARTPLIQVVAVAENGVIGAKGGLPWRAKADLRKFRAITMGKPLVMGRKTFESIGRALDGRDNIVVSRKPDFRPEGVIVAPSLDKALAIAEDCAQARGAEEICVIGGGEIFAKTLALASRLHVTHIAAHPEGDTVFPEILPAEWAEVSREALPLSEGDDVAGVYVVYEKHRPSGG